MKALFKYYHDLTGEDLPELTFEALQVYQTELIEWNSRINLTAIRNPQEMVRKHFMDSLSLLPQLQKHKVSSLIDVGTGAGFPGLPLKIVKPDLHLVLNESIEKKAHFCQYLIGALELDDAKVVIERAETLGKDEPYRETFDCAVARAVASLPTLLEYLLPLVKVGGVVIAQKGASALQEIEQARNACALLGGGNIHTEEVHIPGLDDERYLVIIEKKKNTPAIYPRRVGLPSKKPIL